MTSPSGKRKREGLQPPLLCPSVEVENSRLPRQSRSHRQKKPRLSLEIDDRNAVSRKRKLREELTEIHHNSLRKLGHFQLDCDKCITENHLVNEDKQSVVCEIAANIIKDINTTKQASVLSQGHLTEMKTIDMKISVPVEDSFNSFNYWRPCLPNIDEDLSHFLVEEMDLTTQEQYLEEKVEEAEFNSFNFWRTPLPDFGAGLLDGLQL